MSRGDFSQQSVIGVTYDSDQMKTCLDLGGRVRGAQMCVCYTEKKLTEVTDFLN